VAEQTDERVRVAETRCPFCHEAIARGQEPVACPACHAAHHEACLREQPTCSACGASHPRFVAPAPEATVPLGGRLGQRVNELVLGVAVLGFTLSAGSQLAARGAKELGRLGTTPFVLAAAALVTLLVTRALPVVHRGFVNTWSMFVFLVGVGHFLGPEVAEGFKPHHVERWREMGVILIGVALGLQGAAALWTRVRALLRRPPAPPPDPKKAL
jgi:hypothetical protein